MKPVLIEITCDDDSREWGVSFTSANPEPLDYVKCASKEDAVRLQEKLNAIEARFAAVEKLAYHAEQQGQCAVPLGLLRDALGIQ